MSMADKTKERRIAKGYTQEELGDKLVHRIINY